MVKKAYLQVDYTFTILFFVIFLFFIYNETSFFFNLENNLMESDLLKRNAEDICKSFVSSPGLPKNWEYDINSAIFLGFKNISGFNLDSNKLSYLNDENYFFIKDLYNVDFFIKISISNISNKNNLLEFGTSPDFIKNYYKTNCFSVLNGSKVLVSVEAWK